MRVLLDTQTWLWMQVDPQRLNDDAISMMTAPDQQLLLSAASSWEIAIKVAIGKLALPSAPAVYVPDRMHSSGVIGLPVTHAHALAVAALPQHHRDPFDRLLVAQAQLEGLTILTANRVFDRYDVSVRWSD